MLLFASLSQKLYHSSGMAFCPISATWSVENIPAEATEISLIDAVKIMQSSTENRFRIPIGIVGTCSPSSEQYKTAEIIGEKIASLGFAILCGGRNGVMEAACKGARQGGGISIGILPGDDPNLANAFVTIPIASGIGFARNAVIARASLCLIVVGGGNGTLSEIAYGLQFGKKVFGVESKPYVEGMDILNSPDAIVQKVCATALNLMSLEQGNVFSA